MVKGYKVFWKKVLSSLSWLHAVSPMKMMRDTECTNKETFIKTQGVRETLHFTIDNTEQK